jgi:hypothetical protein
MRAFLTEERTLSLGVSPTKMAWMRDRDLDFNAIREDRAFRAAFDDFRPTPTPS